MFNFTKRLLTRATKFAYRPPTRFYFCNQKTLSPVEAKIKQVFIQKGRKSQQYHQQMAKAMKGFLQKYDLDSAVNLQLFHLSLIKDTQGETSEHYRSQLREIAKFCINRQQYDVALKLIEQLESIQSKIEDIQPLDHVGTLYLKGYILMLWNKFDESKKCFEKCLKMKHVKEAPEAFFKIRAELGRVLAYTGQKDECYKVIQQCDQILNNRQIIEGAPPMVYIMELTEIFTLSELASILQDAPLAQKYLKIYQQKLQKTSNKKDPIYIQFLERNAKIYFNMKQFEKSVEFLKQASKLSSEIAKQDPRFQQNVTIFNDIIENITKEHLKK